MPLVGDRIRSASRPHRSLRRLLRRRLFASAPLPMVSSRAMHPDLRPRAGATGARFKSSPDASPRCAPDLVALHPRPHLSPPSSPPPPMIPIRSVSLRRSQRCAERRQNILRKWLILKQKGQKNLAGLRPAPRRLCQKQGRIDRSDCTRTANPRPLAVSGPGGAGRDLSLIHI